MTKQKNKATSVMQDHPNDTNIIRPKFVRKNESPKFSKSPRESTCRAPSSASVVSASSSSSGIVVSFEDAPSDEGLVISAHDDSVTSKYSGSDCAKNVGTKVRNVKQRQCVANIPMFTPSTSPDASSIPIPVNRGRILFKRKSQNKGTSSDFGASSTDTNGPTSEGLRSSGKGVEAQSNPADRSGGISRDGRAFFTWRGNDRIQLDSELTNELDSGSSSSDQDVVVSGQKIQRRGSLSPPEAIGTSKERGFRIFQRKMHRRRSCDFASGDDGSDASREIRISRRRSLSPISSCSHLIDTTSEINDDISVVLTDLPSSADVSAASQIKSPRLFFNRKSNHRPHRESHRKKTPQSPLASDETSRFRNKTSVFAEYSPGSRGLFNRKLRNKVPTATTAQDEDQKEDRNVESILPASEGNKHRRRDSKQFSSLPKDNGLKHRRRSSGLGRQSAVNLGLRTDQKNVSSQPESPSGAKLSNSASTNKQLGKDMDTKSHLNVAKDLPDKETSQLLSLLDEGKLSFVSERQNVYCFDRQRSWRHKENYLSSSSRLLESLALHEPSDETSVSASRRLSKDNSESRLLQGLHLSTTTTTTTSIQSSAPSSPLKASRKLARNRVSRIRQTLNKGRRRHDRMSDPKAKSAPDTVVVIDNNLTEEAENQEEATDSKQTEWVNDEFADSADGTDEEYFDRVRELPSKSISEILTTPERIGFTTHDLALNDSEQAAFVGEKPSVPIKSVHSDVTSLRRNLRDSALSRHFNLRQKVSISPPRKSLSSPKEELDRILTPREAEEALNPHSVSFNPGDQTGFPSTLSSSLKHKPSVLRYRTTSSKSTNGNDTRGGKKYKVKPYGLYTDEQQAMTEGELHDEMLRPSRYFENLRSYGPPKYETSREKKASPSRHPLAHDTNPLPVSSPFKYNAEHFDDGRIGSLIVEVLGCVGLPKSDRFGKPDTMVYLVCGSSAFCTETIKSSFSPIWPSESRRAAVFPLFHAYARLFVGVFGERHRGTKKPSKRKNGTEVKRKERNDYYAGRVVIDIALVRPDSQYDITLPLRYSSFIYDRRPRGVIRLRFSVRWYNQQAAVLSYINFPKLGRKRNGESAVTLPCADAKTFRNVAMTVYGSDLPGKYSGRAFRSYMRETGLYQIQIRFLVKNLAKDIVTYERPWLSFYLFTSWMSCVYNNSVRLAPSLFVGSLIFLLLDNYRTFNRNDESHNGFSPLTIGEMVNALLRNPAAKVEGYGASMGALLVMKKTGRKCRDDVGTQTQTEGGVDHKEFPFSERDEYTKIPIHEALARKSKFSSNQGDKLSERKKNRLSICNDDDAQDSVEDPHQPKNLSISGKSSNTISLESKSTVSSLFAHDIPEQEMDAEDWEDSDEASLSQEDSMASDDDAEYFSEDGELDGDRNQPFFMFAPKDRGIPVGPQQNADILPPKRQPPRLVLKKLERKLHDFTLRLFDDNPVVPRYYPGDDVSPLVSEVTEGRQISRRGKKRKKQSHDEFDKRLGLDNRHSNPLTTLTAAHLEPIMRIVHIYLSLVRVSLNISAWKDPYLSFWVLCLLIFLAIILFWFPWREFMFVVGLLLLGPQNMILKTKMWKQIYDSQFCPETTFNKNQDRSGAVSGMKEDLAELETKPENKRKKMNHRKLPRFGNWGKKSTAEKGTENELAAYNDLFDESVPMRAFSALGAHVKTNNRPTTPTSTREVVIPYSRMKKERFYDWPPDPTVSSATPLDRSRVRDSGIVDKGPPKAVFVEKPRAGK